MKHIRDNAETSIRNAIYFKKSPWKFTDQDHIYGFKNILSLRRAVQLNTQNNCETYLLIRSLSELPSLTGSLLHLILKILELFFENTYFVEQPLDLNL